MTEIHDQPLIIYNSVSKNAFQKILKSVPQKEFIDK